MRFRHAAITNFKCFAGSHEFDFAGGRAGLHFVTGRNEWAPELGANGAGKTSLFDAAMWALYGRSISGARAESVACWYGTGACAVELSFEGTSGLCTVLRTYRPNRLELSNGGDYKPVAQTDVDAAVGLPADLFRHVVVVPQAKVGFLALAPAAKLEVFSELIGLDRWLGYARRAGRAERDLMGGVGQAQGAVTAARARVERAREQVARQRDSLRAAKARAVQAHQMALEHRARWSQRRSRARARAELGQRRLDRARSRLAVLVARQTEAREAAEPLVQRHAKLERLAADARAHWRELEARLRGSAGLAARCPTCGQQVSDASRAEYRRHLKRHCRDAREELQALVDRVELVAGRLERRQAVLDRLADAVAAEARIIGETSSEVQAALAEMRSARQSEDAAKAQMAAEGHDGLDTARANTSAALDELAAGKDDLARWRGRLARRQHRQEAARYWSGAFRRIRIEMADEAVAAMEAEVNAVLPALDLPDWSVGLSLTRETKAGSVARGFAVLVRSPEKPDGDRWECWSEGEAKRLCLAGAAGLVETVAAHAGLDLGVEVWDEPSAFLSTAGVESMVQMLDDRARRKGAQIWLIDHRTLDFGGFESVTTIVRDQSGSRIETD